MILLIVFSFSDLYYLLCTKISDNSNCNSLMSFNSQFEDFSFKFFLGVSPQALVPFSPCQCKTFVVRIYISCTCLFFNYASNVFIKVGHRGVMLETTRKLVKMSALLKGSWPQCSWSHGQNVPTYLQWKVSRQTPEQHLLIVGVVEGMFASLIGKACKPLPFPRSWLLFLFANLALRQIPLNESPI